jgi:hypothetical protein
VRAQKRRQLQPWRLHLATSEHCSFLFLLCNPASLPDYPNKHLLRPIDARDQNELPAISRDPNVIGAGCKASCAHRSLSSSGFRHSRPIGTQPITAPAIQADARQPSIPGAGPACCDQWPNLANICTACSIEISPPASSASDRSGSLDHFICEGDALRIIFRKTIFRQRVRWRRP